VQAAQVWRLRIGAGEANLLVRTTDACPAIIPGRRLREGKPARPGHDDANNCHCWFRQAATVRHRARIGAPSAEHAFIRARRIGRRRRRAEAPRPPPLEPRPRSPAPPSAGRRRQPGRLSSNSPQAKSRMQRARPAAAGESHAAKMSMPCFLSSKRKRTPRTIPSNQRSNGTRPIRVRIRFLCEARTCFPKRCCAMKSRHPELRHR